MITLLFGLLEKWIDCLMNVASMLLFLSNFDILGLTVVILFYHRKRLQS